MFAGRLGELLKEFALALGVQPLLAVEPVMKSTGAGSHPQLLQGFLKVHNDLAAVGKGERDHAAHPLVIDIGFGRIVDAVTTAFHGAQGGFGVVQVFVVGHYNAMMINTFGILGALRLPTRTLVVAALMAAGLMVVGCGQKGPLYLPTNTGTHAKQVKPVANDSVEVKESR